MNCNYKVISKKGVVQSKLQIQKSKTCENATISCQMLTVRIYELLTCHISHKDNINFIYIELYKCPIKLNIMLQ